MKFAPTKLKVYDTDEGREVAVPLMSIHKDVEFEVDDNVKHTLMFDLKGRVIDLLRSENGSKLVTKGEIPSNTLIVPTICLDDSSDPILLVSHKMFVEHFLKLQIEEERR